MSLKLFAKPSLFLIIILFLNACVPNGVQAPSGKYIGASDTKFLGIPYAMPPVGQLRWRSPVTKPSMGTTPYYASVKRPGCIQGNGFTGVFFTSEDCLYLNIWRPQNRTSPVPVMVYIHGGSGDIGSGSEIQYEGERLAALYNVIVVTINARLGIMGFLALEDFMDEGLSDDGVAHSGSYNFLDQLKALEWVHNNIAAFGGDPGNVTLFGESAGAISTCYHLASPLSNSLGYFHKAILQSGHCEFKTRTQALANQQGQSYAEKVFGCPKPLFPGDGTTATCARNKSGPELYALEKAYNPNGNALSFTRELPILNAVDDGYFIDGGSSGTVRESMQTYSNTAIPVIVGSNLNEGTLLHAFSVPKVQTAADYTKHLQDTFDSPGTPGDSAKVSTLYPIENYTKPINAVADIDGDMIFPCSERRTLDVLQERGHKVYSYELRQPLVNPLLASYVLAYNKNKGPDLGVFHSSDIPFVFGITSVLGDAKEALSFNTMVMMQEYWTSFAKTGVPVSAMAQSLGVPSWPRYISPANGGNRKYVKLQSISPAIGTQMKKTKCDYWAANQHPDFFDVH